MLHSIPLEDKCIPIYRDIRGDQKYRSFLEAVSTEIFRELIRTHPNDAGSIRKHSVKLNNIIQHIIHSIAHILSNPHRYEGIGISRNQNDFGPRGEFPYTYERFIQAVDLLIDDDAERGVQAFCTQVLGFNNRQEEGEPGRRSRLYPTERLQNLLLQRGFVWSGHPQRIKPSRDPIPALRLNVRDDDTLDEAVEDGNYRPLDRALSPLEEAIPRLTARVKRVKIAVRWENYDHFKQSVSPETHLGAVFPNRDQFFRSFKPQDGDGGRIYGHWVQSVPAKIRKLITLDGEPTTEWDYRAMHMALAYSLLDKIAPEGDPYAVPGFDPIGFRDKFKLIATVSFGLEPGKDLAMSVIQSGRREDRREKIYLERAEAEELVEVFWNHHSEIKELSCVEAWKQLQFRDSEIALMVIQSLLDQDIPLVPIHDSFLVATQHGETLEQAMKDAVLDLSSPPQAEKKF